MEESKNRYFMGKDDLQAVVVRGVFAGSPIVISSWINLVERWEDAIVIEGPEIHLEFLYPHLLRMIKMSGVDHELGTWTGVRWADEDWLNLYFMSGRSLKSTIELLEHKLRRDIVFYSGLKLSEKAVLTVVDNYSCENYYGPLVVRNLSLPEELKENGTIEFPSVIIAPSNTTLH